ncbi:MAG: DUF2093 domain-containing protein [Aestuariivirga sp.]|jgi:hypothetical protein|uniref:DUF2093 domain-containing protein n=1 Tax=Aestuariivirga sp. TaxID=2650926 RepID=UPI0038D234FB
MIVPLSLAPRTEAVLKYLPADIEILREGDFVRCAVTGQAIALDDLRYWDVARQQPFVSAAMAFGGHPRNRNK